MTLKTHVLDHISITAGKNYHEILRQARLARGIAEIEKIKC